MSLSDNNPERRNLVVLASSIIIYYIGDAKLIEQKLSLTFVNIKFDNLIGLTIVVWISLFWFFLRYWQMNKDELRKGVNTEIQIIYKNFKPFIYYLEFNTKKKFRQKNGINIESFDRKKGYWYLQYHSIEGGKYDDRGLLVEFKKKDSSSEWITISGLSGLAVKLVTYASLTITKPSIGSYFIPQMLFFAALAFGFHSLLNSNYVSLITGPICSFSWYICSIF